MSRISIVESAAKNRSRTAIISGGESFTYSDLLDRSAAVAACLLDGSSDLNETRVAFLVPPGIGYAAMQWGIWRAGGIAVPLCTAHPEPELEYVVQDCDADIVVADQSFAARLRPVAERNGRRFLLADEALGASPAPLPDVDPGRRALILYTSGSTGKPKGAVTTHDNIEAQAMSLIEAWEWTADDRILHVLPLHHIHGIINVLTCALRSGATCEMLPGFDTAAVWAAIARGGLSLFMAVPTVYVKLIAHWEAASDEEKQAMSDGCSRLRLMVSGSAAAPVSLIEKWREISGHVLLERYGMTEIGMGLSNPLHGTRNPGYVGKPLPGMEVRLVDEGGQQVNTGDQGEIQVRGPAVFGEYWRRPDATAESFDGPWFRTGDMAVVEDGNYRILGRKSVDIIKTGGYKVSALEIEEVLRTHPDISDCAVVGVDDAEWGERVSAAIVLSGGSELTLNQLRSWAKELLASYKVPTQLRLFGDLPRNAMGKVTKPRIVELFASGENVERL